MCGCTTLSWFIIFIICLSFVHPLLGLKNVWVYILEEVLSVGGNISICNELVLIYICLHKTRLLLYLFLNIVSNKSFL